MLGLRWRSGGRDKKREKCNRKKSKRKIGVKRKEKGKVLRTFHHLINARSCFVKRFFKNVSALLENPLHQHSHSWNCHSCAKHTLSTLLGFESKISVCVKRTFLPLHEVVFIALAWWKNPEGF
jgi:hypothetical protein